MIPPITQAIPGVGSMPGTGITPGGPGGPPKTGPSETSFQDHMQPTSGANNAQGPNGVQNTDAANKVQGPGEINTQKVNGTAKTPDRQDMFAHLDKVQNEYKAFMGERAGIEKQVAEGKLKATDPKVVASRQGEMRNLLHFQMEMQGASMKVEIASKVVEHATSGVKTMMSTQA